MRNGKTPLDIARINNKAAIVEMFERRAAAARAGEKTASDARRVLVRSREVTASCVIASPSHLLSTSTVAVSSRPLLERPRGSLHRAPAHLRRPVPGHRLSVGADEAEAAARPPRRPTRRPPLLPARLPWLISVASAASRTPRALRDPLLDVQRHLHHPLPLRECLREVAKTQLHRRQNPSSLAASLRRRVRVAKRALTPHGNPSVDCQWIATPGSSRARCAMKRSVWSSCNRASPKGR